jgi:magnesium chelatase subunit H
MIRYLVGRYKTGAEQTPEAAPPAEYPEVGVYHPALPQRMSENAADLPRKGGKGHGRAAAAALLCAGRRRAPL